MEIDISSISPIKERNPFQASEQLGVLHQENITFSPETKELRSSVGNKSFKLGR